MGVVCHIFIQTPKGGAHKSGRPVFGSVRYALDKPTEYRDINISLVGKGECSWTEQQSNVGPQLNNNEKYITYTGKEVFVSKYMSILPIKPGSTAVLSAGTYEYPFRFDLPEDIPSTFKNSTCKIAYRIGLKFVKANLFSFNKKFTTAINVNGCVRPVSPEGGWFELEKNLLRPFSKRNHKISLQTSLSKSLFSPGQNADLSFIVTNNTDVKITSIKTELICYKTYKADCGEKKHSKKTISESTVETPSIPADAVVNMAMLLPLPAYLISIQICRIMKQEYKVRVTLRLPMPYINSSMKLPIVLGEKCDENNMEISYVSNSSGVAQEGTEDAPPSYWEVMNEDKEEKEND